MSIHGINGASSASFNEIQGTPAQESGAAQPCGHWRMGDTDFTGGHRCATLRASLPPETMASILQLAEDSRRLLM